MLNRALLADMIGDAYRIIEAEDGKQAVAALQKEGAGISLVLLDYVMPQMNGFDVLEVMNKNGEIAKKYGLKMIDLRLSQCDPTDLNA